MEHSKQERLKHALKQIQDNFGKETVIKLGDAKDFGPKVIPTGVESLDKALGIGGLPKGRIVEIYGSESSGKTSIALRVVAEAQKLGGDAVWIDAEHSFNHNYAKQLGVNTDDLYLNIPEWGEQALEITEEFIKSDCVDIIVIDSVAALIPKFELEGEMGDVNIGVHAKLMNHALKKIMGIIHSTETLVIFINQVRDNISDYGPPEVTTGGRGLRFWSSMRLDVRRVESIKNNGQIIGGKVRIKVKQNKLAAPNGEAYFSYTYKDGIIL